jgi:hypothetical protein
VRFHLAVLISFTGVGPNEDGEVGVPGGGWVPANPRRGLYRYAASSVKLGASSKDAECQLHRDGLDDILVLEPRKNRFYVAIVDASGIWKIVERNQQRDPDAYTIVDETFWSPISGDCEIGQDPFVTAKNRVHSVLGLPLKSDGVSQEQSTDDRLTDPQWSFFGSFRAMARNGGGFVYCYLYHHGEVLPTGISGTQNLLSVETAELQQALFKGRFPEISAAATVSMALQKFMMSNTA